MKLDLIAALEELAKVKKQRDTYKDELDKTVEWLVNSGYPSAFCVADCIRANIYKIEQEHEEKG